MNPLNRKSYSAVFKAKVALEALLGLKTIAEITSQYGVHATQIGIWKKHLQDHIHELFSDHRKKADKDKEMLIQELYRQIGKLKVDLDWLKKKSESSLAYR